MSSPTSTPTSPRQRPSKQQKKLKQDQISLIQQNLKLMKNEADQFLKKANKQLPPITKPRHYLYLNFLKQNITLSQLVNQDRNNVFQKTDLGNNNNNVNKSQTLSPNKSYSRRKNVSKKYISLHENSKQGESIVVIKRNKKQLNKIKSNEQNPQMSQLTGRSFELTRKSQRMVRNSKNSIIKQLPNKNKKQISNNSYHNQLNNNMTNNMAKLRQTHQISGNIIKNLHLQDFPFKFLKNKYNSLSIGQKQKCQQQINSNHNPNLNHNNNINQHHLQTISSKQGKQIKSNNLSFVKQHKKEHHQNKLKRFIFGEKVNIKEKPKNINNTKLNAEQNTINQHNQQLNQLNQRHQTYNYSINQKISNHQIQKKTQVSFLDHVFAPSKRYIHQKTQQYNKQPKIQTLSFLSSDTIDLPNQSIQFKKQTFQLLSNTEFSPLRSTFLPKQLQFNQNINSMSFNHTYQIPKIIQSLPSKYRNKWIEDLEVQYTKAYQLRYSSINRNSQQNQNQIHKNHPAYRKSQFRHFYYSQRKNQTKFNIKKNQNKQDKWQPWKSDQISQNIQNYDFKQILEFQ